MKEDTSNTERPLPVEKLINIERGQTEVGITVGLLPRVDFTNLKYRIKFGLREQPYIEVNLASVGPEIACRVYVATLRSDWPDQQHFEVYDKALYAAAKKQLRDGPDEDDDCTFVEPRTVGMLKFEFSMLKPISGNEILERLNRKLDRVFDELRRMLQVVGEGPNPDKYVSMALDKARARLKDKA